MYASDLKHSSPSLEGKLRRLYGMGRKKINLTFSEPYMQLLQAFDNPHQKLPPVIHVAGTNGKGSIVATLRSILEAGGYKVHTYTSPHLCKFNERIYLAGQHIGDDFLESLIDEAVELNAGRDVTFFEITTTIAFAAFARTSADIVLLETGLGGRQDCTNVVEQPGATIISSISMDHVEYLGDTIGKIAGEKAGIMKRGVPCIISTQKHEEATQVLKQKAASLDAKLYRAGAEWVSETKEGMLHFVFKPVTPFVEQMLPLPNLKGTHQIANAGAALAALKVIEGRFPVTEEAIKKGLQNIEWPARLQDITPAFGKTLPKGWDVWLDGGHNDDAAQILSTQAQEWKKDGKHLHLVLGMMNHKDPQTFMRPLEQYLKSVAFVDIPDEPKSHKAQDIKQAVDIPAEAFDDFTKAVRHITDHNEPGRILIAGSLYLAGHVLKTMDIPPHNGRQESPKNHAA